MKKSKSTNKGEAASELIEIAGGVKVPLADVQHIEADLRSLAVPIDSVKPDPRNAHLHPDRNKLSIRQSLMDSGQQKPISVDGDGIICAGNGTWEQAKVLGWKYIARVRTSLTGAKARRWAIQDNRSGELSEWDLQELQTSLDEIERELGEMKVDFTEDELKALEGGDYETAHAFTPKKEQPEADAGDQQLEPQRKIVIDCKSDAEHKRVIKWCEDQGLDYKAPSI